MSDLSDALGALLGDSKRDFRGQLGELKKRSGSVTAAARAAGVDRRTWQRWESGAIATPKQSTLEKIGKALRAERSKNLPPESQISIATSGRDGRDRHLKGERIRLQPGTMAAVQEVYTETGSTIAATKAFLQGVGDRFYRGFLTPEDFEGGDHSLDSEYLPDTIAFE